MGAQSTTKGFYDEAFRAPPEEGSKEDYRRAFERLARRLDIAMNRLDRLEASDRVSSATTLTADNRNVLVNSDSATVAITLPAGVAGQYHRIVNTGTSGNNVTITPDGTEELLGANSVFTLLDGETLIIVYDATDGWY